LINEGNLPWQGLKITDRTKKYSEICRLKKSIPSEELCKNLPNEFSIYIEYIKRLGFETKPDYFYLRR
jgi:hypothetical protein